MVVSSPRGSKERVMSSTWIERRATPIAATLGVALLLAFALIATLFVRLEQTRSDLERVEGGALLSAVQLEAFRGQLVALGPSVTAGLDEAIVGLESFGDSNLEFDVQINETVQIDTSIEFDREFTVPIETTVPIAQTIETTIDVEGPFGVAIPVDVAVPIELDVPISLELTFPIRETIPVSASVPVDLDVPIAIDVADTGLGELGTSLASGLASFRDLFASFEE
jgi:hypothetical protein